MSSHSGAHLLLRCGGRRRPGGSSESKAVVSVLLPESFRGGCSFGAAGGDAATVSPDTTPCAPARSTTPGDCHLGCKGARKIPLWHSLFAANRRAIHPEQQATGTLATEPGASRSYGPETITAVRSSRLGDTSLRSHNSDQPGNIDGLGHMHVESGLQCILLVTRLPPTGNGDQPNAEIRGLRTNHPCDLIAT